MSRFRNEYTIGQACQLTGRGYWSGQEITVRFVPAPAGTGVRFERVDLNDSPSVHALVNHRESMSLRTVLSSGPCQVSMVEHLLAALYGAEIDNCIVQVNADEMPGLDGSAAAFTKLLSGVGKVLQDAEVCPVVIDRVVRIGTAANWIEAAPSDRDCLTVEYRLDYGPGPIQPQTACFSVSPETFATELSPARTFVTAQQAQQLREAGVASHVTTKDLLIFDDHGVRDNELRFDNECARHKAMDMVGDLALAGMPICGKVTSYRGGHELNAAMASELQSLSQQQLSGHRKTA